MAADFGVRRACSREDALAAGGRWTVAQRVFLNRSILS